MKSFLGIEEIKASEILDSRGNPTIQVEVLLEDGTYAISSVPSGASTGSFEAVELRDGDKNRYNGKGVKRAVDNVNDTIAPKLIGKNVYEQEKIDEIMINLDGTENKSKIGANAILGVSIAVCRAAALSLGIDVYQYLGGIIGNTFPIPMMNILNGGKHSDNNLNIQEFMIMPIGNIEMSERIRIGAEVYNSLKKMLKENGYSTGVGDEGGFAPNLTSEEEALELIVAAVEDAGYEMEEDIVLALDVASTEMYEEAKKNGKTGYYFWKTNILKTTDEMIEYLEQLTQKYPIKSIEDGLAEEDYEGWKKLNEKIGKKIQLVGDDLYVTNIERLKKGVKEKLSNAILIKPNQIGTVTETLDVINYAKSHGFKTIISHRSGETEDSFISDLSVAVNSGMIKCGAPCRTDRVLKYNRLINIENNIK